MCIIARKLECLLYSPIHSIRAIYYYYLFTQKKRQQQQQKNYLIILQWSMRATFNSWF